MSYKALYKDGLLSEEGIYYTYTKCMLPPWECERICKIPPFHILKRGKGEVFLILDGNH